MTWLQGGCPASRRPDSGYDLTPPINHPPTLLPTGSILPVTVYDQHGFRVLFHFARDPLPGRSDVLVVVVSMLSTAPQPIRNIVFQSAVPKVTGQTRQAFLPQNRATLDLVGSQLSVHDISFTGELGKGWEAREIPETLGRKLLPPQWLPDQLSTSCPRS